MTIARDIMSRADGWVGEDDTLETAAKAVAATDTGSIPICGDGGRLRGILTARQIARALERAGSERRVRAGAVCPPDPAAVDARDDLDTVWERLQESEVAVVAVLEAHRYIGLIRREDVERARRDASRRDTAA